MPDGLLPDAPPEVAPAPALPDPMLLEPEEPDVEPEDALPLRFVWSLLALDPLPALSRLHAAMPKASAAAVIAAVSIFVIAFIS